MAGVGFYNVDPDVAGADSESKVGFGGGAGVMFAKSWFVQAQYINVSTNPALTFVLVTAGYRFALGGS
jgi:hypothetical protein